MKNLIKKHCMICDQKMFFLLEGVDLNYSSTHNKFDIYRCVNCGLESIHPELTNKDLLQYYPNNYYSFNSKNQIGFLEKIIYKTLGDLIYIKFHKNINNK